MSEKAMELPQSHLEAEDTDAIIENSALQDLPPNNYVVTPYRWPVLIFTVTALISSSFLQNCFSPIAAQLADMFEVTSTMVVLCNLFFYMGLFLMTIPSIKLIETKGISFSIRLASSVTIIGAWLRQLVMINDNFIFVMIFSIPPSLVQVIFFQLTSKIPNLWFPDNQRVFATSIFGLGAAFGGLLGFTLPTLFVNDKTKDESVEEQQQNFYNYLFLVNLIISLITLPIIFIIRERPRYPPSRTAFDKQSNLKIKKLLKRLVKNKNFLLFVVFYTCIQTFYATFSATISLLVEPYDYKTSDVSITAGSFIIFGILASFAVGAFIDKTKKFKLTLLVIAITVTIFLSTLFFTLPSGIVGLFAVNAVIVGMMIITATPLGFAYSVQITYPIPEPMSNGIMLMIAQLISFLITLGLTQLAEENPLYVVAAFVGIGLIAITTIAFSKEDLRLQRAQLRPQKENLFESEKYQEN